MPERVTLREFKYFDQQIVDDFLSSIEGGLATESRSSSMAKGGSIGGEVGIPIAKLSVQKSAIDTTKEETKTLGDAALFQRLYDILSRLNLIKRQSELEIIRQGDVIEINGRIELPFFEKAIDLLKQCSTLVQAKPTSPQASAILEMLSKSETLNVRIHLSPEIKTALIGILLQRNLRVPKQELEDNYAGLYRVKRILDENETFNILKLPVKFDQKTTSDLIKTFSTMPDNVTELLGKKLTEDDLQVHRPAIILTPVAIYQ